KMHNPNYKKTKEVAYPALAQKPYIVGDPVIVPRVTVPWETQWYVNDERPDKERLNVQIQRWLPFVPLDDKGTSEMPVADWTILERGGAAAAFRGEYVGHTDQVQVPTWSIVNEEWEFAGSSRRSISKRVPVDFQVKPAQQYQYPTMLLDYEGGKR